ncbi:substrate-binding domain-containing protein [Prevotella sp.]|uniref:substrate-binding domain-containing protein n=1 Tax=Prevotella sp. TaxID=59823 RepID=UPI003DA449C2
MKKYIIYNLIIAAIVLSACTTKHKSYEIGVSQCSSGEWREKINNEMLSAQHLYDSEAKINIANCYNDPKLQVRQIDSLIDAGVDLLIVSPYEYTQLEPSLAKAKKKNIPIVLFDRKSKSNNYTAYIGGDNVEAGRKIANYTLSMIRDGDVKTEGRKPIVWEITGPMTMSPAKDRHDGFCNVIKKQTNIDYFNTESDWTPEDCYRQMKKYLKSGKQVDIVFCHSDIDAVGAFKAAKELGKEKTIKFLGIDGLPGKDGGLEQMKNGVLTGTYIYPTHGEEIIQLALNILDHKHYERNTTIQSFVVTPQNVNDIIISTNLLMKQNNYLVTIQNKLENYLGLYNLQRSVLYISVVAIFLLLIALLFIIKAIKAIKRSNRKYRKASDKMRELNEEQTLFYTNASHQLKTPLTLITGPLKSLSENNDLKGNDRELLNILNRNVAQLDGLVSNVINFRKEVDAAIADDNAMLANSEVQQNRDDVQEGHTNLLLRTDSEELPTLLIVDDNADMRKYLRILLAQSYYVIEASDGQSGLQLARESVPDLIVSDVMMPVMDGLQFCKQIKEDCITSHIPVIMLTARSAESQQIEGFEHGADAYIIKPFNAQFLISRINNLLQSRIQLRKLFSEKETKTETITQEVHIEQESTPDRRFMDALKDAIDKHISDAHLKMDDLGEELNMSRVQLYRKVKALTGLSPVELLRKIRLQKAYSLLLNSDMTISEISYKVGFGTPSYFSSCFKKQYDIYPTDVRK